MKICTELLLGRKYALDKSPYQGVEFAWNHTNLWANMQISSTRWLSSLCNKFLLFDSKLSKT